MNIYKEIKDYTVASLKVQMVILLLSFIVFILSVLFIGNAHADIKDDVAVKCILGEVRGEYAKYGQDSFLALASALRNRNSTSGVYGCKANLIKEEAYLNAKGLYKLAYKAWEDSKTNDFVKGATYWGSTIVDQDWINKMRSSGYQETKRIGNHIYFKR